MSEGHEIREASAVIVFDTETTGTSTSDDQIIEITVQKGLNSDSPITTKRIKPLIPISAGATAVHGITAEDLKDCPTFSQLAKGIREVFEKAETIIGYNVSFDLEILQSELVRAKLPLLDLSKKNIVDPYRIWQHFEKRNLASAYSKFVGGTFDDAHSAEADVKATAAVFKGMQKAFRIEDTSFKELSKMTYPPEWVGFSKQILWEGLTPVFGFGKLIGKPVWEAVRSDLSYANWIMSSKFPSHVVDICQKAVNSTREDFLVLIYERYGKPDVSGKSEGGVSAS